MAFFTFRLETPAVSSPAQNRPLLLPRYPHLPSLAKSYSCVDWPFGTSSLIFFSTFTKCGATWTRLTLSQGWLSHMQQPRPGTAFSFAAQLSLPFLQNSPPATLLQDSLPDHPQHTPGWVRAVPVPLETTPGFLSIISWLLLICKLPSPGTLSNNTNSQASPSEALIL